jgi:glycosyltransferase involved in cell wall biosynthesis
MREASVFVLSSRYEGFPIVLLEAMAAGLAVVSFDCPTGPRDIVADGANGILVPAEDVAAMAAALDRVMEDEALRRRLAAAAPAAVEPYSVRAVGRRWDELLAVRPDGRTVAGIDRPPAR